VLARVVEVGPSVVRVKVGDNGSVSTAKSSLIDSRTENCCHQALAKSTW
jgi:hypothetical protein